MRTFSNGAHVRRGLHRNEVVGKCASKLSGFSDQRRQSVISPTVTFKPDLIS